ncbi:MAG: hypothetical protein R2848_01005 [Thermomicrobiales bacterium]
MDHPELQVLLDEYLSKHWIPWAERDRVDRKIKSTYETLFTIYQTQQRSGEQFEVILGLGLLSWQPREGESVNRHLITVPAGVSFDALTGAISIVPGPDGAEVTLEQDMLDPEFRPDPKEEQRVRELLEATDDFVGDQALLEQRSLHGSTLSQQRGAICRN